MTTENTTTSTEEVLTTKQNDMFHADTLSFTLDSGLKLDQVMPFEAYIQMLSDQLAKLTAWNTENPQYTNKLLMLKVTEDKKIMGALQAFVPWSSEKIAEFESNLKVQNEEVKSLTALMDKYPSVVEQYLLKQAEANPKSKQETESSAVSAVTSKENLATTSSTPTT